MKAPAQLLRGGPIVALVAAGFALGTLYLNFQAHDPVPGEARSCALPPQSENYQGGVQVDARGFVAILQMCRS